MKKIIFILMCLITLICVGCSKDENQDTLEKNSEASDAGIQTEDKEGIILGNKVPVVLESLKKGDTVNILDEYGDYYVVRFGEIQGYVEKRLVHVEGEAEYESWNGNTKSGAVLHENFRLTDSGTELPETTSVQVIADFVCSYLVKAENVLGYMSPNDIYRDGGAISLNEMESTPSLDGFQIKGVSGNVLVDDAKLCCAYLERNDSVEIINYDEESCIVDIDGSRASISRDYIQMDSDAEYKIRTAYAKNGAVVYEDSCFYVHLFQGLEENTEVRILNGLGNCYLVEVGNMIGYMKLQDVRE